MPTENLNTLAAFAMVAEERSFTRAAARLGVSQSALSQSVRGLENRLGLRLLTRTTRSVSLTEAGDRLLRAVRPALDEIDTQVAALSELRDRPSGNIRITSSQHAAETVLWPVAEALMREQPDINIELSVDAGFRDIVADRFDAGVRLGEQVAKDMIAVRIGPDVRMAMVAAPEYLARRGTPVTPQDLTGHDGLNFRMPTLGGLYAWELEKDGRELNVRVETRMASNDYSFILKAARAGLGVAFGLEEAVREDVAAGRLVSLLEDWCPAFPGYHLYYPSRRHSAAFALFIEALRQAYATSQR
jgi:DNA-binding transcriptional LysR family regulator